MGWYGFWVEWIGFGGIIIKDPFVFLAIGTKSVNCRNLRGRLCNISKVNQGTKLANIEYPKDQ